MPESPLIAAGAQVPPIPAAALHTNEFFTGMWTQGNPLGAGAVPYLYQKFYSAIRFERLIGGQNTEITTRLTLARRPGNSVYNAGPFPPINRFYEFRAFSGSTETIHVLASVDPAPATPIVLNVATTQGVKITTLFPRPVTTYYTIVTFTAPVPVSFEGQMYAFAGLTTAVDLNGENLAPALGLFSLGPDQQVFLIGSALYGPTVDTGTGTTLGNPATVRDVTGPTTNLVLWDKSTAAGRTSFQTVGNVAYFADGVDAKKWVLSGQSWEALESFSQGEFIVDTNNNLQAAIGSQTATIVNIEVIAIHIGILAGRQITLFFDPLTPLVIPPGATLTLAGLTTVPAANGLTLVAYQVGSGVQVSFQVVGTAIPVTAFSVETGSATTGTGITGAAQPAWETAPQEVTADASAQWLCIGSAVENWGFPAPAAAPTVTQVLAPSVYPAWAADTWYAPLFVILDTNGNLQQLTTAGTTGGGAPAWNVTTGGVTADNTCVWTNLGPAAWAASTNYTVGQCVQATFTYYITVNVTTYTWNGYANVPTVTQQQQPVTVTCVFRCTVAGTSGINAPNWTNGNNTSVSDGTVTWTNSGTAPAWPGAAQTLSLATQILDSNQNLQQAQILGKTAAAAPVWGTKAGSYTADGTESWLNTAPFGQANTAAWIWAFSGKNSVTGHIGTASPLSSPLTTSAGFLPVLQGAGLAGDPQIDQLVLWRTLQGGSTLLYEDTIPNPASGNTPGTWIYTDTTPDSGLNEFITAPISDSNDPPPVGFTPQCYYQNRIWGFVNNVLQWSGGPDTITGNGNEAFPPVNQFPFPSLGVTCWPTSIGLIIYTNSDVWVVLGQGTAASPYYVINFQQGVGLANQDAFTVNGSTAYGMLTSGQVVSMDPGAGEVEVGFPIGDLFNELYTTAATYMTWHQGSSADMALYVADGALGWFRMAAVAAPESGNVWSPRALINNGLKAIASIEIEPGQKRLLLGPAASSGGPILMRDSSVSTDNGTAYQATAIIGSVVMAQPGTTVGVQFVTTEEIAIAGSTPLSLGLIFDEISGTFSNLVNVSNDPPNLYPSQTITAQRFWAMQDAQTVKCRHLQTEISWPAEPYANELLTHTIYGRLPEKARK